MDWAPLIRNFVRYAAGTFFGAAAADMLKTQPDLENLLVIVGCTVAAAVTEWIYKQAKARGWTL